MLPVDVSEIHAAVSLAYKVYKIGWNRVHDARELPAGEALTSHILRTPLTAFRSASH